MIEDAEEFVWILTDQVLASTIPYLLNAIGRGVEFRLLMPGNYLPSGDVLDLVDNPIFEKASRNRSLSNRFLENVDLFLCLSEKEIGALAFPKLDGKFDYIGFVGKTASQIEWSKQLYLYYWSRAKSQIPDQLAEYGK
jgi:predicted transcriptional regulator